jgi:hypothetical protein
MSVVKNEVQCTVLRFTVEKPSREILLLLWTSEGLLPRSPESTNCPYPEPEKAACPLYATVWNLITRDFGTRGLGHFQRNRPRPRLYTFCNMLISYGEDLSAPCQNSGWRTTNCLLSATVYWIYSQVPCIFGGHILHPQAEDAPCCGDIEQLSMPYAHSP